MDCPGSRREFGVGQFQLRWNNVCGQAPDSHRKIALLRLPTVYRRIAKISVTLNASQASACVRRRGRYMSYRMKMILPVVGMVMLFCYAAFAVKSLTAEAK